MLFCGCGGGGPVKRIGRHSGDYLRSRDERRCCGTFGAGDSLRSFSLQSKLKRTILRLIVHSDRPHTQLNLLPYYVMFCNKVLFFALCLSGHPCTIITPSLYICHSDTGVHLYNNSNTLWIFSIRVVQVRKPESLGRLGIRNYLSYRRLREATKSNEVSNERKHADSSDALRCTN